MREGNSSAAAHDSDRPNPDLYCAARAHTLLFLLYSLSLLLTPPFLTQTQTGYFSRLRHGRALQTWPPKKKYYYY
ncbi:hypothetical protein AOQ84DRAFT_139559 [Glonium stellatum]|uniref:Uncharacterized protein n=1 Tax=Glonium stellatum TaxID=574774 RepID=A0A8E2JNC7_9PEZI|nr:hypothetical protein AOQ84DRAFT_139559 [Glonium stellatum]